jgi:hypothetical protein
VGGKRVANPGFSPEIHHPFFVWISAGAGYLSEDRKETVADLGQPLADFRQSITGRGQYNQNSKQTALKRGTMWYIEAARNAKKKIPGGVGDDWKRAHRSNYAAPGAGSCSRHVPVVNGALQPERRL